MSTARLLTFNAGSSSVKIGVFSVAGGRALRLARAVVDLRRTPPLLQVSENSGTHETALAAGAADDLRTVVAGACERLAHRFGTSRVVAVGHRVVHGGDAFGGPVRIDDAVLTALDALAALAPLHQPQNLELLRATRSLFPDIVQTASFDTAFHRTNGELARRFALPRALHDEGIRRYGFHGLSYAYVAGALARCAPAAARGKVVAAHLGSGASLCAMEGGVSRDTSMGFSTLDGVPMATRCGALDPGVLLYLLGPGGRSLGEVEEILYTRSGLLGVSGVSADSRELLRSERPEARQAIELFTFRVAGEVARLAATLGGLDALVFTAGVGENQPAIRAAIATRLAWLGLELDPAANAANAETIGAAGSRIAAFVIPTDEEQVIADEALSVVGATERI